MNFRALLCRKIGWHENVLETMALIQGSPDEDLRSYFQEMTGCGQAICEGTPVDLDTCDEFSSFCAIVSESIWDHFTALHEATVDS